MNECQLWTGAIQSHGYGTLKVDGRTIHAHRHIYELHNGPIAKDYEIHHRCNERRCINPDHLEAVDSAEHRRIHNAFKPTWTARAERTHCKNGHEFTPENTGRRIDNNGRICRTCKRNEFRRRRLRETLNHYTTTP
jgi:hypothetical protein